ncbi:MAG: DNA mismatch repair endonuclease MutL [Pirellulales bacterium]|nr:DNA mismatch repair endonuclease MutL [Pirellulales bacterium]
MPFICQLAPNVISQIAAGEVIERPASVVKELVENALDAQATRIDVAIQKGGMDSIRVVDNGFGIVAEELPLALASHATSKIHTAEDLFRVGTLGFRGEALASIAAVSHCTIRSRPPDAEAGAELTSVAGELGAVVPVGCPPGTTIEVRHLLFNTPVRRKFLRTTQTEMAHITEVLTRLALANIQVHFTLSHNGRSLYDLPSTHDPVARIAAFFGDDIAAALIPVHNAEHAIQIHGYVAHPSWSRSNQRWQYLFLNGRSIRDRSLSHALSEAYRGYLVSGRYPICFLQITMPPDAVDVNVHPTKQEVRFQDSGKLYSQLLGTLRTKFLTSDLKARAVIPPTRGVGGDDEVIRATEIQSELVDWAKHRAADPESFPPEARITEIGGRWTSDPARLPAVGSPAQSCQPGEASSGITAADSTWPDTESTAKRWDAPDHPIPPPRAMQIHNRYLIAETAEGIEVIDQHALHERILYEQLRAKVTSGALETQQLLVPEPVEFMATEAAIVVENRTLLAELGLQVEPFGGKTVLISAYPAMLANMSPADVLRDLVEQLVSGGQSLGRHDLLDALLHRIACKAAVKYGDHLAPEEISALLAQRHLAQDHHHCPHGRPTALVFTREDLDRQFKRI